MTEIPNHICQICGNKYYACDICDKIKSWRAVSCSSACYQIYLIITQTRLNIINKEESIKMFNSIGINTDTIDTFEGLTDIVKNQIKQMITNDVIKSVRKPKQKNT